MDTVKNILFMVIVVLLLSGCASHFGRDSENLGSDYVILEAKGQKAIYIKEDRLERFFNWDQYYFSQNKILMEFFDTGGETIILETKSKRYYCRISHLSESGTIHDFEAGHIKYADIGMVASKAPYLLENETFPVDSNILIYEGWGTLLCKQ